MLVSRKLKPGMIDIIGFPLKQAAAFVYLHNKLQIMPSFDLVSKVDLQTLDNAINVVRKENNQPL